MIFYPQTMIHPMIFSPQMMINPKVKNVCQFMWIFLSPLIPTQKYLRHMQYLCNIIIYGNDLFLHTMIVKGEAYIMMLKTMHKMPIIIDRPLVVQRKCRVTKTTTAKKITSTRRAIRILCCKGNKDIYISIPQLMIFHFLVALLAHFGRVC